MKSRKKLKGMTLIEIIIAMAVFALLGVILLGIGQVVDSTTKSSSRLNKKMTVQAPYAAAKNVVDDNINFDINSDGVIDDADKYYYEDNNGNKIAVTPEEMDIDVYFGSKANPDKVKVKNYEKNPDGTIKTDPVTSQPVVNAANPEIEVEAKSSLEAKKYSTKKLVEDDSLIYDADSPNANLNFQFVDIQPATTTP